VSGLGCGNAFADLMSRWIIPFSWSRKSSNLITWYLLEMKRRSLHDALPHCSSRQSRNRFTHLWSMISAAIATVAVARGAVQRVGKSASLTVTACEPLPFGWTGKLWAVRAGIEEASLFNPKYVLLTDADMVHHPQSIATLLHLA
jgi:hypothetical protein